MPDAQRLKDLAVRITDVIEQLWILVYLLINSESADEMARLLELIKAQQRVLEALALEMQMVAENRP